MDHLRAQLIGAGAARGGERIGVVLAALLFGAACVDRPAGEPRPAAAATPAGEGGSLVSLDSALVLFRRGLEPAAALGDAESSIDGVIARLATSLAESDTNALRALVMSRREFAYLYYPTSPYMRAPTKQEPGLAWFLHLQNSQKGATRLMNRYGGTPFRLVGNECTGPTRFEGENVLWDDCTQTIARAADTVRIRLIAGIIERGGRFKVLSYGNDL